MFLLPGLWRELHWLYLTNIQTLASTMSITYADSTALISVNNHYLAAICTYSDSQVTLSWIAKLPETWKQFIRNRVAKIQELILNMCLRGAIICKSIYQNLILWGLKFLFFKLVSFAQSLEFSEEIWKLKEGWPIIKESQ